MKKLSLLAALITAALLFLPPAARAQNCGPRPDGFGGAWARDFSRWCTCMGGTLSPNATACTGVGSSNGGNGSPRAEREPRPSREELRRQREQEQYRQQQARIAAHANALFQAGQQYEQAGNWAAAEAQYHQALQGWGPWWACAHMAHVLERQGKYEEAIKYYGAAIDRARGANETSRVPMLFNNLGVAYLDSGKPSQAAYNFRKALDQDPHYATARENLALTQRQVDNQTAGKMHDVLAQPVPTASASTTSSSGLEFMQQQTAMDQAAASAASTSTGLRSNTPEGKTTGRREDANRFGRSIFDTDGPRAPASASPPVQSRASAKLPAVEALRARIPQKAMKDTVVRDSFAWYASLEGKKVEKKSQLANLQKDIDIGAGDPSLLNVQKTQLANEVKFIEQDQKSAQQTIKSRMTDLGVDFTEAPSAGPAEKTN